MLVIASGADNRVRMAGHNAHDVVTADDWEDWPDLDLLQADPDAESDDDGDEPEAA